MTSGGAAIRLRHLEQRFELGQTAADFVHDAARRRVVENVDHHARVEERVAGADVVRFARSDVTRERVDRHRLEFERRITQKTAPDFGRKLRGEIARDGGVQLFGERDERCPNRGLGRITRRETCPSEHFASEVFSCHRLARIARSGTVRAGSAAHPAAYDCPMLAAVVLAGIVYHFTSDTATQNGVSSVAGRIWSDGPAYRLELDPRPAQPHQFEVAVSTDGDQTVTWMNRTKGTFHVREKNAKARSSLLFHLPGVQRNEAVEPRITHEKLGKETVAGRAATKHNIRVDYHLRGIVDDAVVRGTVWCDITVWTDNELPRLPFERPVQTGFEQLDKRIAKIYDKLPGMTVKSEMTVTRVLEGGPPVTEKTSTVIDELQVVDVPATMFETK